MSKGKELQYYKTIQNYRLYEEVGSGQYGKVYKGINTNKGDIVAIKVIPLEKFRTIPKLQEFTTNEIKTLERINNPNVIKYIEMLRSTNNVYSIYEYCEGNTLEVLLQKKNHFDEIEALKIFSQLLNGFKALYKENILHRDLKPSNILFHNNIVKIADFGFCKRLTNPQELTKTIVGTPAYMAPEILKGYPYTIKADIWSLGVVLYEMLFGICPFEDPTISGLIQLLDKNEIVIRRDINNISVDTEKLLMKLLTQDTLYRIDWPELTNYPLNTYIIELESNFNNANQESYQQKENKQQQYADQETLLISTQQYTLDEYTLEKKTNNDKGNTTNGNDQEHMLLKILMKERNKILYIIDIIFSTLEYNLSITTPLIGYIMINNAYILISKLKKDISVENLNSKYSKYGIWPKFVCTDLYHGFSCRLNEEYDLISNLYKKFKLEIQNILTKNHIAELDVEIINALLQDAYNTTPEDNYILEEKYIKSMIINYVEEIYNSINLNKYKEEGDILKYLLYCVNVLEYENIQDFFENNIDGNNDLPLYEQHYFQTLFSCDIVTLRHNIQNKLTLLKKHITKKQEL